jgi:[acyl-carrier-protein] S-malonyltransferase
MMKIALLFPGYGSQYVGMGKEFYDDFRVVQEYFEEASNCVNENLVKLCFASSDAELAKMNHAYAAIFLVSSSLYAVIKEHGIEPMAVAGYDQGEYAALFAAGGINFPDALYLLNKSAVFYQELLNHDVSFRMIRVEGISSKVIEGLCAQQSSKEEYASVAFYMSSTELIVSGTAGAVDKVAAAISELSQGRVIEVGLQPGLHSHLMQPVADQFRIYLEKADFKDLRIPLYRCTDGKPIMTGVDCKEQVVNHLVAPVKWTQIMAGLASYDILVEVGPGTGLAALAKHLYPDKMIISINKRADIEALQALVQTQQ